MNSPIELPTTRQSRYFHQNVDIHDPNWIPVLNKSSNLRSQTSSPFHESGKRFPSRGSSRAGTPRESLPVQDGSKSSQPQPLELEGHPLSNSAPRGNFVLFPKTSSTHDLSSLRQRQDARVSDSSEEANASVGGRSTPGTASVLEEQIYILPGAPGGKEERSGSVTSLGALSTLSKRPSIPTSKYNRKPGTDTRSQLPSQQQAQRIQNDSPQLKTTTPHQSPRFTPVSPPTRAQTVSSQFRPAGVVSPHESPMMAAVNIGEHNVPSRQQTPALPSLDDSRAAIPSSPQEMEAPPLLPLPVALAAPPIPEMPAISVQRPDFAHRKSTASVRKARALHSHPSTPSLRGGESPTITPITASAPVATQSPLLSALAPARISTNESRRSILYDQEPPSAAPSEPLPDLPPAVAKKGTVRETHASRQSKSNNSTSSLGRSSHAHTRSQHKELASFMTSKSTVVFRRFDDIHIKLLLSIQDEIAQLEKELAELENGADHAEFTSDLDRERQKIRIMGELRKLLAEYDHLFANWSSMQAAAADGPARQQVETWLARDIGDSESAREDLLWVKSSEDLSCVQIGDKPAQTQHLQQQLKGLQQQEEMLSQLAKMAEAVESKKRTKDRKKSKEKPIDGMEMTEKGLELDPDLSHKPHKASGGAGGFAAFFSSCTGRRK